jgi:hypothetical protein
MELSLAYENQPEDVIALIRYQLANNRQMNRRRFIVTTFLGVLLVALGFAGNAYFDSIWFVYGFTLVTAILVFGSHLAHKHLPARIYKKKFGKTEVQAKRYRITVKKSGLLVKSGAITNKHDWSDYLSYVLDGDYLFLFNKQGSAHVIPKRDVDESVFIDFFNIVSKQLPEGAMPKKASKNTAVKKPVNQAA